MPGLRGSNRVPGVSARERRNQNSIAMSYDVRSLGDGLSLDTNRLLQLALLSTSGLEFSSGELAVKFPADGGLKRSADGLEVDMAGMAAKADPADTDLLLLEDVIAGDAKKKVTFGELKTEIGAIIGNLGSTDNALMRADGAGGKTAQGSLATLNDNGNLTLEGPGDSPAAIFVNSHGLIGSASISMQLSEGTHSSPTDVSINSGLGLVSFLGYEDGFAPGAKIQVVTTENWADAAHGAEIQFLTNPNAGPIPVLRMVLENDGNLSLEGNDLINVGDVECDSLTKDGAGDILLNSNLDLNGKHLIIDAGGHDKIYEKAAATLGVDVGSADDTHFDIEDSMTAFHCGGYLYVNGQWIDLSGDEAWDEYIYAVTGAVNIVAGGVTYTFKPGSFTFPADIWILTNKIVFHNNAYFQRTAPTKIGVYLNTGLEYEFSDAELDVKGNDIDNVGNIISYTSISKVDNAVVTTVAAGATPVQVLIFDTNGPANGPTPDHTNDHITIATTGDYDITVTATIDSVDAGAISMKLMVKKNNGASIVGPCQIHRDMAGSGGEADAVAITGQATLTAADTIEVWIENETDGNDFVVQDICLTVTRLTY